MVTPEHIGQVVTDGERTGVLMALEEEADPHRLPVFRRSVRVAYVRPKGGGIEWDAPPSELEPA